MLIDLTTKKNEELSVTKGKEVIFMGNSQNNQHLIVIFKNGTFTAIDNKKRSKTIKNFLFHTIYFDYLIKKKEIPNTVNFNVFTSNRIDKIIVANPNILAIWFQHEYAYNNSNDETSNNTIFKLFCYND